MVPGQGSNLRPIYAKAAAAHESAPGRFDPSLPLAFRIADAFGLSVEEVFDKTDV
jgi:DNA-binding XRE family transcriptional regulator